MNYFYITNPSNKNLVSIYSDKGKKIIEQYSKQIGGGTLNDESNDVPNDTLKKTDVHDDVQQLL
mgnify:CR=1